MHQYSHIPTHAFKACACTRTHASNVRASTRRARNVHIRGNTCKRRLCEHGRLCLSSREHAFTIVRACGCKNSSVPVDLLRERLILLVPYTELIDYSTSLRGLTCEAVYKTSHVF
eukprot:3890672-Pleurochrysis_carterae.AAC.2